MSDFEKQTNQKTDLLIHLFYDLLNEEDSTLLASENEELIKTCRPADVPKLIDRLVAMEIPMDELKKGVNKLFGLLHQTISEHPYSPPSKESYLGCLLENNRILDEKLQDIKLLLQEFKKSPKNTGSKARLISAFHDLDKFRSYYRIKEEILFPEIEKYIAENGCLSVMGSFHSDVKEKMNLALQELNSENTDLDEFDRLTGELFFTMYAIKFREERVLYSLVQDIISDSVLNSLYEGSMEIGFPYFQPEKFDKK